MANESIIKLFEDKKIRIVWNEEKEQEQHGDTDRQFA